MSKYVGLVLLNCVADLRNPSVKVKIDDVAWIRVRGAGMITALASRSAVEELIYSEFAKRNKYWKNEGRLQLVLELYDRGLLQPRRGQEGKRNPYMETQAHRVPSRRWMTLDQYTRYMLERP
jgi:hypothetical protein